jgi:hypothetical protein
MDHGLDSPWCSWLRTWVKDITFEWLKFEDRRCRFFFSTPALSLRRVGDRQTDMQTYKHPHPHLHPPLTLHSPSAHPHPHPHLTSPSPIHFKGLVEGQQPHRGGAAGAGMSSLGSAGHHAVCWGAAGRNRRIYRRCAGRQWRCGEGPSCSNGRHLRIDILAVEVVGGGETWLLVGASPGHASATIGERLRTLMNLYLPGGFDEWVSCV